MKTKQALFSMAIGLLAAGCGGTAVQSGYAEHNSHYDFGTVGYAVKGGSMPLVIHGVPYNAAKAETDRVVSGTISMPPWFGDVPFELAPVDTAPGGDYRTVLVFNADRFPGSRFVCGDLSDVPVAVPKGELRIHAAFCAGDYIIAQTFAQGPTVNPDIAKLRRILDQVSTDLFPPDNPDTRNDPGGDFVPAS